MKKYKHKDKNKLLEPLDILEQPFFDLTASV